MLLSMTGHGHAGYSGDGLSLMVEIRTVNSRFAKVNVRCGEVYQALEPQIEELVRKVIRRGTVQVNVRVDRNLSGSVRVNEEILNQYVASIRRLDASEARIAVENLMGLPGVIEESSDRREMIEQDWGPIRDTVREALESLDQMRHAEGKSMAVDLLQNCELLEASLDQIERLAPEVVKRYQQRLSERIRAMLEEVNAQSEPADVIKEVGIFAEKSDVSEETVRLRTHIEQFRKIVDQAESQGRKLDFLTQEMFRETNTIGSKSNNADISQHVVDLKTIIERIREMVQNVE